MPDESNAFASFERKWLDANPEQAAVLVFLRPEKRDIARAFGSLIHELTQTAFVVREPQVAAAKLSWWQQELRGAAAGNPRHPISSELFRNARAGAIDPALWVALIDGAIAQLDASFPTSVDDLFASLSAFFGPVAAIETKLCSDENSRSDASANLWICSHLMFAVQNAANLGERLPLPLDLLARHGVSRAELGSMGPNQTAVMKDFIGRLRDVISTNLRAATNASLGRRVRARLDHWLADHAIRTADPVRYLSQHARNTRWRNVWWSWREARYLTSESTTPT